MATLNIRLDETLKKQSAETLGKLGITPSEYLRDALEYVVTQKRSPFKTLTVTEEEETLIKLVRARLDNPQKGIEVNLDDL